MKQNRKPRAKKKLDLGANPTHLDLVQRLVHVGSWELDLANLEDINRNPLRWSDETFRLLGYEPGEVEPSNELFFKAVHPGDRGKIKRAVARALEKHIPYTIKHRVVWPDGTVRHVQEESTIVYDAAGKPKTMLGVVQDITHRSKPDSSLESAAVILQHIRYSVIVIDLSGRVTYCNQAAEDIFGYSAKELIGSHISRLYVTQDLKKLRHHISDLLAGNDFDGEWEGLRKDGTRVWLRGRRTVVRDANEVPIGFMGFTRDITGLRRDEKASLQSEPLYRAVGESIDFGVWTCDPQGRLTQMSESFMKLLGLTPSQNLADSWLNALAPEERADTLRIFREGVSTGRPWNHRYRIRGSDGQSHLVHAHAAPVRDADGQILCWAGLNLDVRRLI